MMMMMKISFSAFSTAVNEKKRSERRKRCALSIIKVEQTPFPRGCGTSKI